MHRENFYLLATLLSLCFHAVCSSSSLAPRAVGPGVAVDAGTQLRILPLGDSITWGFASPDGNGYRLELYNELSGDDVVFAGTVQNGNMVDNWMAGYPGKTIQYIANQADGSLAQGPNIILLMAGTNDMNPSPSISTEGSEPNAAAQRLGNLIDQCLSRVPSAAVIVAKIPNAADASQESNTQAFNALIPGVVSSRAQAGKHVAMVDMSVIQAGQTVDGIHPNEAAYQQMGDIWYQGIHALPSDWIQPPVGPDPPNPLNCGGSNSGSTSSGTGDINANGGPDPGIPAPVFLHGKMNCEIALGLGHPGSWKFNQNWVSGGQIASGLHLDMPGVQLFDMDGDGKAEYLWVNEQTGQLICWHNNQPDPWAPCGSNNGIIASGAGSRAQVFFADMNADRKTDYLVVDGDTGAVTVYWNLGPDASADNGWRFNPGGVIATGVPHANLETLRFADMDGDGRADYVIIGEGGSLGLWLNQGTQGGIDVLFVPQGGIASGASSDIGNIILSDVNGDGRADYLIWDQQAGLSGFLNIRTRAEGTPFFADQGGAKSIAQGITQNPDSIRLADIDGDGWNDYCYIDDNGALWIWYNRGMSDASVAGDGVRLGDIDGDHIDDYIWLDEASGAPTVYLNKGPNPSFPDGWQFDALNGGGPIASGAGPRAQVHFGDLDGDNRTDYLVLDPVSGAVTAFLNGGPKEGADNGWQWNPIGNVAAGLGPGANARFADIDGDGKVDYIELGDGGRATIWKNNHPGPWSALPNANAAGVGRPAAEISFADVDGDGKADYIWTEPISGQPHVWYNKFPADPTWAAGPYPNVGSEGAGGQNVIFGKLEKAGGATAVFVNPDSGAIAAFVNGCGPGAHKRSTTDLMRPPQSHPKRGLRQRASCPGQPGPSRVTPTPTSTFIPITPGTSQIHHGHQPTPTGIEPSGPWTTVQCDFGSLGSAILNQNDASQRWQDAQADNAWQNLVAAWNYQVQQSSGEPAFAFSNFAYDFFHSVDETDCPEPIGPCPAVTCQNVNHPAGFLILNSLHQIWQNYAALHTALSDSDQLINGEMPAFQEAFSPLPNHFSAATIALDVLSTVTGIAFAGFWSAAKPAIGGALGDVTKDGVNSAISSAYTIGQQYVTLGSTRSAVINSLDDIEAHIWDAANAASNQTLRDLMSSYDSGNLTALGNIIANGAVLAINNHMEEQLNKVAQQIIYGGLIKARWQAPEGGETVPLYPYVMYVPNGVYECGADPKTAIALPGDGDKLGRMINADAAKNNVFCDQYGNSFFLLQASSAQTPNNVDGDGLPGGDKGNLDGSRWGGVTLELVTQSVMHGFQNSGQNPFGLNGGPDYVDAWTSTSNPTIAPGFWGLPLCFSVDAVLGNTSKVQPILPPTGGDPPPPPPGYPCPGDGGAAQTFFNRIGPSGFLPGQCALHWELYHDSGDRRYMDVTVKDAAGYNVGLAHSIDATPPIMPAGVTGRLPNPLNYYISQLVTGHKADIITFSYGSQTWRNTDPQCVIGKFNANDGNNVSGDCAFQC